MGYELYRILAMSTPCMASNKCAPPKKKKSSANNTSNSQEPEIIDLEEEEKHMDFLIGMFRIKYLCPFKQGVFRIDIPYLCPVFSPFSLQQES